MTEFMKIPFHPLFIKMQDSFSPGKWLVFWYRHYKVLIFVGFILVLSIGGWNYYYSLYQYQFSDAEKKQYVDSYFKETAFKEDRFLSVIQSLQARARMHGETFDLKRNIFEKGSKP